VLVYPATESLLAVTFCPVLVVSPLAVSSGYGVQLQLVPRGTESPNATIDHDRDGAVDVVEADVVEEEVVVEEAADFREFPHAVETAERDQAGHRKAQPPHLHSVRLRLPRFR
jgi:hypothetical protein